MAETTSTKEAVIREVEPAPTTTDQKIVLDAPKGEVITLQPADKVALPKSEVVSDQPPAEHEVEPVERSPTDFLCQEFPLPDEKVKVMEVRASSGQSIYQELGIWSILTGVMCVVFKLVEALKKYATDLAMILVGAMLGGAVARFGRNIIRRAMGMISL